MEKEDCYLWTLFAVVCTIVLTCGIAITNFDSGQLTDMSVHYQLVDKWHNNCISEFDSDGNYYGDDCSREWTMLVKDRDGLTEEVHTSEPTFKTFVIGDNMIETYQLGRLGFKHNEQWSKG